MKIRLLLLTFLSVLSYGLTTAQTQYKFGFCSGKVETEGKLSVEGSSCIEAAIYLSADDLERFSGDSFAGVNAGLTSKLNVHDMTAWIRKDLDGENLAETYIDIRSSQKPRDGWNSMTFETPVDIEPQTGYYVGYTLNQTKTSSAVSFVNGSHEGASWIRTGDGEWQNRADLGVLCIEALITGDNLPQYDMQLLSASLSDDYYVTGTPISLTYEIRNDGMEPIYLYTLKIKAEDSDAEVSRTMYQTINYGVTRSYKEAFVIPGLEPGRSYRLTVSVEKPNGVDDEVPGDNSITLDEIPVIASVFPRTVLLEEFTTERCSNCPAAAQTIHDVIETFNDDQKKRFAMVCHHSGFHTDPFTLPCDTEYIWFYNDGGAMYAPAFMLDRVGQTGGAIKTPVFGNLPVNAFSYKITQAQNVPALYSVAINGTLNESARLIDIRIEGETVLPVFDNPRITVYVVEDDVPASEKGQNGSGGAPYFHNHLERAYNATWGEPAEWDGDSYSYSCQLEYPEGCNTGKMQVVAFISNFDGSNPVNCEVGNAAWKELIELEAVGIDAVTDTDAAATIRMYDLSGRLVNTTGDTSGLPAGVYIVSRISGSTITSTKVTVK